MFKLIQRLKFILAARKHGSRIHIRADIKNSTKIHLEGKAKILAMASVDGSKNGKGVWIGQQVTINPYAQIQGGLGGIRIEDGSEVNNFTFINGDGSVKIGRNVLIGPHVTIVSANHGFNNPGMPIKQQESILKEVVIEDDVWIGASAVILPGVHIGKGSIVGAGAVVTKHCAPGSILFGVPAQCHGFRPGYEPSRIGARA